MVTLRPMLESDRTDVSALVVSDEQLDFVDPLSEALEAHAGDWDDHVIVADDQVVGFFQIDSSRSTPRIPDQLELHEVRIGSVYQGRGYGKAFMTLLGDYLAATYPGWPDVCLSVNCRNETAYRIYQQGGFVDTGEIYHGGSAGPQHVMTRPLP